MNIDEMEIDKLNLLCQYNGMHGHRFDLNTEKLN